MREERKFVELELPESLGLHRPQVINVLLDSCGIPRPLVGFDLDGTIHDGHMSYHDATKELVMMYSDDLSRVPTVYDFKMGVHPDLHAWGVPRHVPLDAAWESFSNLVLKVEERNPSRHIENVPKQLQKIAERLHLVIITLNSILPVASIVKRETGLDVDVVVVEDKEPVLTYLAEWHSQYHDLVQTPFYYFGDSKKDMEAARHPKVHPVGVARAEMLKDRVRTAKWCYEMRERGARHIISHSEFLDFINNRRNLRRVAVETSCC